MKRFVALLDILGFKDMIMNNPHDEMVRVFNNFRIYLQMGIADHKTMEDQWGRPVYDVSESVINSNIISDSIILWTSDSSTEAFFELVWCIQRLTNFCHNYPMISLRGGITFGDFEYDYSGVIKGKDSLMVHPIMLGEALVDAYEIEKKLQIAGCIIDPLAIDAARATNEDVFNTKWKELEEKKKLVLYDMPTKKEPIRVWTINWVSTALNPSYEAIKEGFSSFNKTIEHPDVKIKMENTLEYYSYIKASIYSQSDDSEGA